MLAQGRSWPAEIVNVAGATSRPPHCPRPLPRLLKPEAIKRTIADGVNQKLIAYAGKTESGRYEPFVFEPNDLDVPAFLRKGRGDIM